MCSLFFFSSRRRHTRWTGDWSSDVCSSDLPRGEWSEPVVQVDEWLSIRSALAAISPRRRAAVVLVDYVGMDAGEAGGVLGLSAGTVRTHLMRGRRDLRKRLGLGEPEVAE